MPKIRPIGLAEVKLRVRTLPKEKSGQPLFTRCSDNKIGIWLAFCIEMLSDVLDVNYLGKLINTRALAGLLLK